MEKLNLKYETLGEWVSQVSNLFGETIIGHEQFGVQGQSGLGLPPEPDPNFSYDNPIQGETKIYYSKFIHTDLLETKELAEKELIEKLESFICAKIPKRNKEETKLLWRRLPSIQRESDFQTNVISHRGIARLTIMNPEMPDERTPAQR